MDSQIFCRGNLESTGGAALWGMLRCAALELPSLNWRGVDYNDATPLATSAQVGTCQHVCVQTDIYHHMRHACVWMHAVDLRLSGYPYHTLNFLLSSSHFRSVKLVGCVESVRPLQL